MTNSAELQQKLEQQQAEIKALQEAAAKSKQEYEAHMAISSLLGYKNITFSKIFKFFLLFIFCNAYHCINFCIIYFSFKSSFYQNLLICLINQ